MKSFIFSLTFFALMLIGIIIYQNQLTAKSNDINEIIENVESVALKGEVPAAEKHIHRLRGVFSDVKEWIMIFEDHDQILSMAQCIESMDAFCKNKDTNGILSELYKFKYLLNYFSDSVKPTIENIL